MIKTVHETSGQDDGVGKCSIGILPEAHKKYNQITEQP